MEILTDKLMTVQALQFLMTCNYESKPNKERDGLIELARRLYPSEEDKKMLEYCINDVKATQAVYEEYNKTFGPRLFKNSVAIIRTRKGNTVGCHMVYTHRYRRLQPKQFVYDEYVGQTFELTESVGGMIVILVNDILPRSNLTYTNTIRIENVIGIEIMSEHDQ